jgi:hypothetical protein
MSTVSSLTSLSSEDETDAAIPGSDKKPRPGNKGFSMDDVLAAQVHFDYSTESVAYGFC